MRTQRLFHRLGIWLSVLALSLGLAAPALADTSANMDAFFNGALGSANVSGPSAYRGQSANYYSGGSLVYRTPQQSVALASVQLPSLKAGCGGIDAVAGGFSFINSAQLVAFSKAIVSNAIGFAFHAAINYLMPQVGKVLEHLQKIAQDINSRDINSCQLAQQIDAGLFGKIAASITASCIGGQMANGSATDAAQAAANCQSNAPGQARANNDRNGAIVDTNYAFNAIRQIPYLVADEKLANLVMNMVGTVIVDCEDNASPDTCTYDYRAPDEVKRAVDVFLQGGDYAGYVCPPGAWAPGAADDACNAVQPGVMTIDPAKSFSAKVDGSVQKMLAAYVARQPQAMAEQQLLGLTNLPLLRLIRTMVSAESSQFAAGDLATMKDEIAAEITIGFVMETIRLAEQGASRDVTADDDTKREWRANQRHLQSELYMIEANLYQKVQASNATVERILAMQRGLSASAATRFASAAVMTSAYGGR